MKMQLKKCYVCIIFLLAVISVDVNAKNGIYVMLESGIGIQSGLPGTSEANALYTNTSVFPSIFRAAIGYNHDLYPCLGIGLDIGIGRYGNKKYVYFTDNTYVHSRTIEFLALLQWHFKQWDILGKVGGIRETLVISGYDGQNDQTQLAPEISAGIAYNLTPQLSFMAGYSYVFGDKITSFSHTQNKSPSLNEVLIGMRYIFGE